MARIQDRHPAGAPGPWFVDDRCIDCDAECFGAEVWIHADDRSAAPYATALAACRRFGAHGLARHIERRAGQQRPTT